MAPLSCSRYRAVRPWATRYPSHSHWSPLLHWPLILLPNRSWSGSPLALPGCFLTAKENSMNHHWNIWREKESNPYLVKLRNWRRVVPHLRIVVVVVDKVAHPNKLMLLVRAGEEDCSDSHSIIDRDFGRIWVVSLKDELVLAYRDGTNHHCVQHLIVGSALSRTNICQLPLQICDELTWRLGLPHIVTVIVHTFWDFIDTLKDNFELKWAEKGAWIVEHFDVTDVNFCHLLILQSNRVINALVSIKQLNLSTNYPFKNG